MKTLKQKLAFVGAIAVSAIPAFAVDTSGAADVISAGEEVVTAAGVAGVALAGAFVIYRVARHAIGTFGR